MKKQALLIIFFTLAIFFSGNIFYMDQAGAATDSQPNCPPGSTCLTNPLQNEETDARKIIGIVIKAALGIVGAVTLLMFVMGAQAWLTSAGNSEKVTAGAKTMLFAAIGALLVFASYIVVNSLTNLITGAK